MALANASGVDCARAAAMGVHSAAGLCVQLRKNMKDKGGSDALAEASRLLRTAEALCRQGVAVLVNGSKNGGAATVDAGQA